MNLQRCLKMLELETIGSLQEVKGAYKDLVRVWHPDRFQSNPRLKQKAEQKLREINLAYNYLREYIESNQTGGISSTSVTSAVSPSGINVTGNADQSGGHRSGMNSRAAAGNQNPDAARFAISSTKTVPRTSFIGRYVLLAFLGVLVAISALIVYFLSNTDEIASKTRGMASEVMEEIVNKLEKKETNQKIDPSVKELIKNLDRPTQSSEIEKKFEIHLKSGSIIMTEAWWEESDMVMYRVEGGSMGIERNRIKKIVKR